MEILDKYIEELKSDLKLERISLDEKTLFVPGIKGKWLSRMYNHKNEFKKYEILFEEGKQRLIKEMEKNSDIAYSKATLEKVILDNETIKKITNNMKDERILIEFCEKCLSVVSSMTYDIKNIIEWSKLELT